MMSGCELERMRRVGLELIPSFLMFVNAWYVMARKVHGNQVFAHVETLEVNHDLPTFTVTRD